MRRAVRAAIEWEQHITEMEVGFESARIKDLLEDKHISFFDACLRQHGIETEENNSEQIKIKGW